jgi:hypothetical protein
MFWIQVITMGVIKGAEHPNHDPFVGVSMPLAKMMLACIGTS